MKNWPPQVINLMFSADEYIFAHLYTITLADGAQDFFTDLDMDVTIPTGNPTFWPAPAGTVYKSTSLRIEGMRFKLAVGTEVDEQEIKIFAMPGDSLAGSAFLAGVTQGLLSGAWIRRDRIFWPIVTGSVWRDIVTPLLGWPLPGQLSYMRVSEITKIGRSHVELKAKSPLILLNQTMPHRFYQPGCQWTLYQPADPDGFGCKMVKARFGITYMVGSNPTALVIPAAAAVGSGDPGPGITVGWTNGVLASGMGGVSKDGQPSFAQGRLLFTSGALANQQVSINTNDGANFYLRFPLSAPPVAGDNFTAYAGCGHNIAACGLKFGTGSADSTYAAAIESATSIVTTTSGNMANYGGFDLVPAEHIGL